MRCACTGGVSRSSAPTTTAVGTERRASPGRTSSRSSTRAQLARTPVGQACAIRTATSVRSAGASVPMIAYLSPARLTGPTGPSGSRDRSTCRCRKRRSPGGRTASGTIRTSARRSEGPVEIRTAAAVRPATSGRAAPAMMVMPPMLCPARTARSPSGTTRVSTAARSSASARVE